MATPIVTPIVTSEFRAAFTHVWVGKPPQADRANGKPRFTVLALFPPDADLAPMKAAIQQAGEALWDSKAAGIMKMQPFKAPFKQALDICNTDGEPYFAWARGWTAAELWSYIQPGIAGPHKDVTTGKLEVLSDEATFYSGVFARAKVRAYAYDGRKDQRGFGVNFELMNLQKLRDAERLGGSSRTRAEDDFEPIPLAPADDMMA